MANKDPAFLFYASDFLTGTMFMSNEQIGKYIRLLCSQHQHGGIIAKDSFNNLVGEDSILRGKFIECDTGFYNERLSLEMVSRSKKSTNISKAAKETWAKRKEEVDKNTIPLQSYNDSTTIAIRTEDEDENEIKDVLVLLKEREEKFKEIIRPFVATYGSELCNSFYEYWTEPNKSNTKMRFEQQQTWEIKRRLKTWANNNKQYTQKKTGRAGVEDILLINKLAKDGISND
jgi:uncharacterized protein YdaU (DUF1376 family)